MTNSKSIDEFITKLARRISRVYPNSYTEEDDYIQIGHLKLAEIRQSPHVKHDFLAYAIISIARAMRWAAVDAMCAVSAPHRTKALVHKAEKLISTGSTEQEVCDQLCITANKLSDLKMLFHYKSWQELFEEPFSCSEQFSFFNDLMETDLFASDELDFLQFQLDGIPKNLGLSRNQIYRKAVALRPKLTRSGYGI